MKIRLAGSVLCLLAGCHPSDTVTPSQLAHPENYAARQTPPPVNRSENTIHRPAKTRVISQNKDSSPPKKVALMLPLSGHLKNQAEAIRNGFFSAYYEKSDRHPRPEIQVYDTSEQDIGGLYEKAKQADVDLVVGPLLKENIRMLVKQQKLTTPVLALNHIALRNENLYQFGLSPDTEASQVADEMARNDLQQVVMITPDNAWGKRIANDFESQWRANDGTVTTWLSYRNSHLAPQIRNLLGINQSQRRIDTIKKLLNKKPRYKLRRRQDFDGIFLVASPELGRQIMPLLRFYYAGDVPIYSISGIYRGHPNTGLDRDLNGIIFVDIPWLIDSKSLDGFLQSIQQNSQASWPLSYEHYPRFYALGVDAYGLMTALDVLSQDSGLEIAGATGGLSLDNGQHIKRQLSVARMTDGKPQVDMSSMRE